MPKASPAAALPRQGDRRRAHPRRSRPHAAFAHRRHHRLRQGLHNCPQCGSPMEVATVINDIQDSPKSRVLIDIFGGLHVKTPFWARAQGDFSYLIKALDQPKPFLKSIYPHIADKIDNAENDAQMYERMARTPSSFTSFNRADDNMDLCTHRQIWLRTWAFEALPEDKKEIKKRLYKKYPNGCYVAFVGDCYAESLDQDMDKYWTVCKAGLSTYIHSDALGQPLIPAQELRNVLINLTAETVEQGIGSGFADPDVLDFSVYSKHEARPGLIYPARPRPGQTMGNSFFETGRATLSKEVGPFMQQLDKDAQFLVGSYPSLYGGPGEGNSRTLGEYQQSRVQALQRLTIAWSYFVLGWAKLMEKCVHLYVENMIDDERYTIPDKTKKDSYVNVWIRKADLTGHVGEVEPEGADNFPISTPQKQGLFFELLQLQNQFINTALFDAENRRILADLLGFPDLFIPGEDQAMKQASEIADMIKGLPVEINPIVDDGPTHIEVARNFLCSQEGLEIQKINPIAYQAILAHLQAHIQQMEQNQADQGNKMAQQYVNVKAREQILRTAVKSQAPPKPNGMPNVPTF